MVFSLCSVLIRLCNYMIKWGCSFISGPDWPWPWQTLTCCNVWADTPSSYLELLDKLQKWICRTVCPSLAASHKPLAHCQNVTSLSLLYRYYFGRCSSELAELVLLPFSWGSFLVILIDCMIFLPPFLGVTRMFMLTVSFFAQLDSGILWS